MAYTRKGPFSNGSSTPPIDALFLNGIETFLLSIPIPGVINAVNPYTGWFHADQYGAIGDGVTDDRAAIQAAVNDANTAYTQTGARQVVYIPPRTHVVGAVGYSNDDNTANGAVSIKLLDGVEIYGPGILKVKAGAYGTGANYAVIRSKSGGLSHAAVRWITIDGNTANNVSSIQCSNIQIEAKTDVEIDNVKSLNANGNGILVRGPVSGAAASDISIHDCYVNGATAIGIQSSQFNGLTIVNNTVRGTTDNAIDVYGEDGTTTPHAVNGLIEGNRVSGGLVGIFLETVGSINTVSNWVSDCTSEGIHVNRINGAPSNLTIEANHINACPTGIGGTGDTGGVVCSNNTITGATYAGIVFGGGGGNSSRWYVTNNAIFTNNAPLILVRSVTPVWSYTLITGTTTNVSPTNGYVVNYATTSVSNTFPDPTWPGK